MHPGIAPVIAGRGPSKVIAGGTLYGNLTQSDITLLRDGSLATASQCPSTGNVGYAGVTFGVDTWIDYVEVYGASGSGHVAGSNPSVTLNLRTAPAGAAPAKTGGTLQGTTGAFTDNALQDLKTIDCADKITPIRHTHIEYVQSSSDKSICAELIIYGWQ